MASALPSPSPGATSRRATRSAASSWWSLASGASSPVGAFGTVVLARRGAGVRLVAAFFVAIVVSVRGSSGRTPHQRIETGRRIRESRAPVVSGPGVERSPYLAAGGAGRRRPGGRRGGGAPRGGGGGGWAAG